MKPMIILTLIFILFSVQRSSAQSNTADLSAPLRFPYVDLSVSSCDQPQPLQLSDGRLMMVYASNDTIYCRTSSDEGLSWSNSTVITTYSRIPDNLVVISATITKTGRVAVIYSVTSKGSSYSQTLQITYSDDNGASWSQSKNVLGRIRVPTIFTDKNNTLWIAGRDYELFYSTNNGLSWNPKLLTKENTFHSLIQLKDSTVIGFYQRTISDYVTSTSDIYLKKSTDNCTTWKDSILVAGETPAEERPRALITSDGTIYVFYQVKNPIAFPYRHFSGFHYSSFFQYDIYYKKSQDNGNTWSSPVKITQYAGDDCDFNVTLLNQKIYITFLSDRYSMTPQIWSGIIGTTSDEKAPPAIYEYENTSPVLNVPVTVTAYTGSHAGISSAEILFGIDNTGLMTAKMYDDGLHNDVKANDNIWTGQMPAIPLRESLIYSIKITDKNQVSITYPAAGRRIFAQVLHSWMAAGSLHNYYSNIGAETEQEPMNPFYYNIRPGSWSYPGIYKYQDMMVWKGLWIGSADFTDETGSSYPYKVVHVGPRVTGQGEFFPIDFRTYSRFQPTRVLVNGKESFNHPMQADITDPSISADRMIVNTINTQLGLTLRRRIMQFSRQFNDNYIIQEYTFKNTGNTDADDKIELTSNPLKGLYFYFNYRWTINQAYQATLFASSNPWTMNTMYDARGDGVLQDPPGEDFRTAFAWHGYKNSFLHYNNIGGPVWDPANFNGMISKDDTTGRLAAPQFAGVLTLHSDKSSADHSDNLNLPQVSYIDNDGMNMQLNDAYDRTKMRSEYLDMIAKGKDSIRHADKIHPAAISGGTENFAEFANQTTDPDKNTGGGYSVCNSYGPYTLAPGDSVTITVAEGAASISREAALEMGKKYKAAYGTPDFSKVEKEKNLLVLTGKDSLMQTWKRARENYKAGWRLPVPPNPPEEFNVTSTEDRINLSWKASDPSIKGFEIYRTSGKYENDYTLIKTLQASEKSFQDTSAVKGTLYFYYILSTGNDMPADPALNIPAYRLKSSRYYTQTYDGASPGMTGVGDENTAPSSYELYANYPNPFNPSTTIAYDLAEQSHVELKIFDILGREVRTLIDQVEAAGHHKVMFNAGDLSSGMYLYRIKAGEFVRVRKMMVVK